MAKAEAEPAEHAATETAAPKKKAAPKAKAAKAEMEYRRSSLRPGPKVAPAPPRRDIQRYAGCA